MNIRESLTNQNMPLSKSQIMNNLKKVAKLAPQESEKPKKAPASLMETISNMEPLNELGETPKGKERLQRYVKDREENVLAAQEPTRAAALVKLQAASDLDKIAFRTGSQEASRRANTLQKMITKSANKFYRAQAGVPRAQRLLQQVSEEKSIRTAGWLNRAKNKGG